MMKKGTRDEGRETKWKGRGTRDEGRKNTILSVLLPTAYRLLPTTHRPLPTAYCLLLTAFFLLLSSCNQEYSPKPKAYPRVVFPERKYELFQPQGCPYQFEKPVYANAVEDTTYFERNLKGNCWYNIEFRDFNGTLNLTYKPLNKDQKLEQLVEDAHKLSFKHSKKADYIDEVQILNPNGVRGLLYEVGGDAASNVQFYLTDSSNHFIRGALYFNNTPNADSMRPVIDFVKEDLRFMLKSFQWK